MAEAYVSFVSNDEYAKGAVVLGRSLQKSNTSRKSVLMVTSSVSNFRRNQLIQIWDELVDIDVIDSPEIDNLVLLQRPELMCTYSKLRAWTLTQFKKCVFLDADTLVLQNIDDLFEKQELSAAPDIGWPDCFNSGVFVFKPSVKTFEDLLEFATKRGSFDGGDQGLLNEYFSDWSTKDISCHLPYVYNMVSNVCYTYMPAFKRYGKDAKVVHFLGTVKPWQHFYDNSNGKLTMQNLAPEYTCTNETFIRMWWELFSIEIELATISSSTISEKELPSWENWHDSCVNETKPRKTQRQLWEEGHPDYKGKDKFKNIHNRLEAVILTESTTKESVSEILPEDQVLSDCGPKTDDTISEKELPSWGNWHDSCVNETKPRKTQRQLWEEGHPDYKGKDKFESIQNWLNAVILTESTIKELVSEILPEDQVTSNCGPDE